MNTFKCFLALFFIVSVHNMDAQVSYTANTKSNKYDGYFLYGANMGYRGTGWTDAQLADILVGNAALNIAGVGANSLRPALYEHFVERWGYDVRLAAFQHYQSLGAKENTVFIGYPSGEHTENKEYCQGARSKVFANLYEPIWDGGANGTPVNENNYYAVYVYRLVKKYGPYVKFWEIWNEPDYTSAGVGDKAPGAAGNWWDNDPDPCHLSNLKAPIQSYVRLLRISYEVIKSVDPDAFVCVGGIGYASFLDAVLRNTDNPDGGKITPKYPEKGGAWFDCVSFHIYPMYYLRRWDGATKGMAYYRTSDAAAQTVVNRKNTLQELLGKYGYGSTYPGKEFIVTECNIPRKSFNDMIGSDEAQRNFLLKTAVVCQQSGINALYVYGAYESKLADVATTPYDVMGLYQFIPDKPYLVTATPSGVAWRTAKQLLSERKYNNTRTLELKLPGTVGGGAFYSETGKDYIYVLWAKSAGDNEQSSSDLSFPASWKVKEFKYQQWGGESVSQKGSTIKLTESPVFIQIPK